LLPKKEFRLRSDCRKFVFGRDELPLIRWWGEAPEQPNSFARDTGFR
jgi:hypothetical protein